MLSIENGDAEGYEVKVYNTLRKVVRMVHGTGAGVLQINVVDLPSGLYIVQVTNAQGTATRKPVLIQR